MGGEVKEHFVENSTEEKMNHESYILHIIPLVCKKEKFFSFCNRVYSNSDLEFAFLPSFCNRVYSKSVLEFAFLPSKPIIISIIREIL